MPLPEHRSLPLVELRTVVASGMPARLAHWRVYGPGETAPWPDRLTAVPFLMVPLRGELRIVLPGDATVPLRVGEGVAFLAGSHATVMTPEDGSVLRITLDRPLLYSALASVRRTADPDFRNWDHRQRGIALARDQQHDFDELLTTALEHMPAGAIGWREDLVAAAWQLLRRWLMTAAVPLAGSRAAATWQLADAYLRDHLAAASRAGVAAALGLHPSYLSELCRRHTGRALAEHLRALRLERAALLLRETSLNVRRIATAVGWSSDGYLERRFKQQYGMTPGRWRRVGPG